MTPGFWDGRRVLVTGHTGFKGAWLSLWLDSLGATVHGYALDPPTSPSLYEDANVSSSIHSNIADIRDLERLSQTIDAVRPEVVFHLAAQSLVLESYADPVETFTTNVIGTVHVLEALRRAELDCAVVAVTTDKVYENRGWPWRYRENDALGGHDPYSSSKAACELVVAAYRDSFFGAAEANAPGIRVATARAGNVIGGGDWTPGQLVPDTIAALEADEIVLLRHPNAIRPWQHVLDCLSGYLLLAEHLGTSGAETSGEWNFGPLDADCVPVFALVDGVAQRLGVTGAWTQDPESHAAEEAELLLDSTKAVRFLGWRPKLTLDIALDWVVDWYRARTSGSGAYELCRAQLDSYSTLQPPVGASERASEPLMASDG